MACVGACISIALAACMSAPVQDAGTAKPAASAQRTKDGPPQVPSELRKLKVQSRDGSVIINVGDYHCAEGSHSSHGRYGDCDNIPAVVLLKPDGSCIGLLPYADLWIHSNKKRTKVVWQIFGPPGYQFDTGKDGIEIDKQSSDPTLPGSNYDGKQNQGRKFKWELKEDALTPRQFYHLPNIVDPNGVPCEPIDPGMINLVN